jgi:hypothetical protein
MFLLLLLATQKLLHKNKYSLDSRDPVYSDVIRLKMLTVFIVATPDSLTAAPKFRRPLISSPIRITQVLLPMTF